MEHPDNVEINFIEIRFNVIIHAYFRICERRNGFSSNAAISQNPLDTGRFRAYNKRVSGMTEDMFFVWRMQRVGGRCKPISKGEKNHPLTGSRTRTTHAVKRPVEIAGNKGGTAGR